MRNINLADDALRFGPREINRKKSVLEIGTQDLHAIGKQKGALKLAGSNAAMQILPLLVIHLTAANDELIFFYRDVELLAGEASHCQRDSQALRLPLAAGEALDIVGRIAIRGRPADPVERPFDIVKPQKEGGVQIWHSRHLRSPSGTSRAADPDGRLPRSPNMVGRKVPFKTTLREAKKVRLYGCAQPREAAEEGLSCIRAGALGMQGRWGPFMRVQPYLFFDGRCQEALDFYKSVLQAEALSIMRFKESPVPPDEAMVPAGSDDKIMHATFRIGDSILMASDGRCQGEPNFEGMALTITLTDASRAEVIFAALADGGEIQMPMTQTFFAQSFGMVADRFGLSWMVLVEPTEGL